MAGQNYSKQREAIYNFLTGRKDHPTAEVIYENVRKGMNNISLGTVYRNLKVLSESGRIRKIDCGDGLDHFDADMSVHQHFVCEKCGRIEDIFLGDLPQLSAKAEKECEGTVKSTDIVFRGICRECLENDPACTELAGS